MLFTDGVGVGVNDPAVNPLCGGEFLLSQFSDGSGTALPPGVRRFITDTTFGVEGRPQSASNQTAIYTASPAPARIGRHVLGYPNAELRAMLAEESIVKRLVAAGRSATFANAYPVEYLDALKLARRPGTPSGLAIPGKYLRKIRASASTLAMAAGAVALRTLDDARSGHGLTHDADGSLACRRDPSLPRRGPAEAAEIFWALAADFTLFEHSLADDAGHSQDVGAAVSALRAFDAFTRAVIASRPADAQVLVCSDHGNVEDLSTRSHTRNPVVVLSAGDAHFDIRDLADVGRAVLSVLGAT